jgi:hypothetical protein
MAHLDLPRKVQTVQDPFSTRCEEFRLHVISGRGTLGTKDAETYNLTIDALRRIAQMDAVPGSLNLQSMDRRVWLRRRKGLKWRRGLLYPGVLNGKRVVFTKSDVFGGNPWLFHVYSEDRLRTEFDLEDGDSVTLAIPRDAIAWSPLLLEAIYRCRLALRAARRLAAGFTSRA